MTSTPLAGNFIEESTDVNYNKQIELSVEALEEVRNFGTQLFHSLHEEANVDHAYIVQLFYLRKMLEIIDSISILISAKASPDALVRTFFECIVYISHILEKETKNRSLAFFYVASIESVIKNNKFNPKTQMGKETKAALFKEQKGNLLDNYIGLIEEKNVGLLDMQNRPDFIHVTKEYVRVKKLLNTNKSKREQRPPWYYLFGGSRSFKDLCDRLGFQGEYKIKYEYLSEAVHAQNIIQQVEMINGNGIKYPLFRRYDEYKTTVNSIFLSSFKIFNSFLKDDNEAINGLNQWGLKFGLKYKGVLHSFE